jgi:hypothetical protein
VKEGEEREATPLYFRDWSFSMEGRVFYDVLRPELEAEGYKFKPLLGFYKTPTAGETWKNVDESEIPDNSPIELVNWTIEPPEAMKPWKGCVNSPTLLLVPICLGIREKGPGKEDLENQLGRAWYSIKYRGMLPGEAGKRITCCIRKLLGGALDNKDLDGFLSDNQVRYYAGIYSKKPMLDEPKQNAAHYTSLVYSAFQRATASSLEKSLQLFLLELQELDKVILQGKDTLNELWLIQPTWVYKQRLNELRSYFASCEQKESHILSCYKGE